MIKEDCGLVLEAKVSSNMSASSSKPRIIGSTAFAIFFKKKLIRLKTALAFD
jgi:hypothetical protein